MHRPELAEGYRNARIYLFIYDLALKITSHKYFCIQQQNLNKTFFVIYKQKKRKKNKKKN